jgi:hypothetical protein
MRGTREHHAYVFLTLLLGLGPAYGCGGKETGEGEAARTEQDRGDEDDLCARATRHVMGVIEGTAPANGPERMVIDSVAVMTTGKCRAEGLSPAQADCILAVEDTDDMMRLGECPAIAANQPSWLILPPPEALERRRQP